MDDKPKLRNARRMANPTAQFVSLVERGANQTPIKIVKSDKSGDSKMGINLSSLIRVTKSVQQAEVVAVVVANGNTLSPAFAAILGEAVEVKKAADTGEQGDIHVIKKAALEEENADLRLYELSNEVTLVTKGFRPYSDDFTENATFSEIMKARTLPIYRIGEVLSDMISDALYMGESKQDSVTSIAAIFDDAKQFVTELVSSLPETVFKFLESGESLITKDDGTVDTNQPEKTDGEGNGETDNAASGTGGEAGGGDGEAGQGNVATTKSQEGGDANTGTTPQTAAEPSTAAEPTPVDGQGGDTPTTVTKEPDAAPADLAALVAKAVADLIEPKFAAYDEKLQSIAKSANDTIENVSNTLGSTVINRVVKSDTATPVQKSDGEAQYEHFDTAFHRPQ